MRRLAPGSPRHPQLAAALHAPPGRSHAPLLSVMGDLVPVSSCSHWQHAVMAVVAGRRCGSQSPRTATGAHAGGNAAGGVGGAAGGPASAAQGQPRLPGGPAPARAFHSTVGLTRCLRSWGSGARGHHSSASRLAEKSSLKGHSSPAATASMPTCRAHGVGEGGRPTRPGVPHVQQPRKRPGTAGRAAHARNPLPHARLAPVLEMGDVAAAQQPGHALPGQQGAKRSAAVRG